MYSFRSILHCISFRGMQSISAANVDVGIDVIDRIILSNSLLRNSFVDVRSANKKTIELMMERVFHLKRIDIALQLMINVNEGVVFSERTSNSFFTELLLLDSMV